MEYLEYNKGQRTDANDSPGLSHVRGETEVHRGDGMGAAVGAAFHMARNPDGTPAWIWPPGNFPPIQITS